MGEDDIDVNDGATVNLTIACDDGTNPLLIGTFTVTLEDSVRHPLELGYKENTCLYMYHVRSAKIQISPISVFVNGCQDSIRLIID